MFIEVFPFFSMEVLGKNIGESIEKAFFIAQSFPVLYILFTEGMEGNFVCADVNPKEWTIHEGTIWNEL
jgi:hypothetical protein